MSPAAHQSQRLTDLWRLGPSEVVALVGAGGKTSLMEALARDYEAEGSLVVVTTTTKILPPAAGARPLVISPDLDTLLSELRAMHAHGRAHAGAGGTAAAGAVRGSGGGGGFAPPRSPVVGRGLTSDGKVEGVPTEWIPELRDLPGVAAVLVEADGAVGRPLKAPAEYEPVIPRCASLVVAVAGLEAQGAPLDAAHVHRPELLAGLLGLAPAEAVPPPALLRACVAGYGPRVPSHAGFLVFLNKADLCPPASDLAEACAASGLEVWSGSVGGPTGPRDSPPDRGMTRLGAGERRPSALIPAAGLAARMGGPKVLAALGEGTVLGRVAATVGESGVVREVVVVAGADADAVEAALARELGAGPALEGIGTVVVEGLPPGAVDKERVSQWLRVVRNPSPGDGMASSLRTGLAELRHPAGLLIVLGDQPLVRPVTLRRIVEESSAHPRGAAVGLAGGPGGGARPPVLLHRSLLPRVLELHADEGARTLLADRAASVACVPGVPEEALDVDAPEDLESVRRIAAVERPGSASDPPVGLHADVAGGKDKGTGR